MVFGALKAVLVLALATIARAQQPVWSQCGGIGWYFLMLMSLCASESVVGPGRQLAYVLQAMCSGPFPHCRANRFDRSQAPLVSSRTTVRDQPCCELLR